MNFRSLRYFAWSAVVAVAYVAAAELGLSLASAHSNVSPVCPPTGIAIAALLFFGLRIWPAVFVGAFAPNVWTDISALTAAGIAVGNTFEAVVAVWLLTRKRAFNKSFDQLRGR